VPSRKANELTALAGQPIDGITAAYQRIVGGFVLTALYFAIQSRLQRRRALAVAVGGGAGHPGRNRET